MSTCYWMIEGVGLNTNELYDKINKRKLVDFLSKELPDDEETQSWKRKSDLSGFDVEVYFDGNPYQNLADLLTYCDDTDTLTYGDNGDGDYFLYYPPSMPWHLSDNDPKSIDEVHQRIIAAVKRLTDLSDDEIDEMIDDDLYEVGYG